MKVLFALSNPPTKEFLWTRHNVGRLFVTEHLLKKYSHQAQPNKTYTAYVFRSLPNLTVCLTETYMNLSGPPVASFLKRSKLTKKDLVVVHDDLEHRFGNVRIK